MNSTQLDITPIPAFSDNYIWLLKRDGATCAVVDPGDHEPVLEVVDKRDLDLRYILLTHHHWDHSGGIPDLLEHCDAQVFGPVDERLGKWCRPCREGDRIDLTGLDLQLGVLDTPAHTRSHIAFYGHGLVFSGDTLFSVGCGKLFEGPPAQMQESLDKLAGLPPETRVYCGHEYTLSNCRFAREVEPDNPDLLGRCQRAKQARSAGEPTLPSTIGEELKTNPFLRTREETVVRAARKIDARVRPGAQTLGVIRAWKDRY